MSTFQSLTFKCFLLLPIALQYGGMELSWDKRGDNIGVNLGESGLLSLPTGEVGPQSRRGSRVTSANVDYLVINHKWVLYMFTQTKVSCCNTHDLQCLQKKPYAMDLHSQKKKKKRKSSLVQLDFSKIGQKP